MEKFEEVETPKEYDGYYYQMAEVISIAVLESLCGLKNMKQVQQLAERLLPEDRKTVSMVLDENTICSTGEMGKVETL